MDKVTKLIIIMAVVLVQYVLAAFSLGKLAYCDFKTKKYVVWNLFILLVFFVGSITFLIYRRVNYDKIFKRPDPNIPLPADNIIDDEKEPQKKMQE